MVTELLEKGIQGGIGELGHVSNFGSTAGLPSASRYNMGDMRPPQPYPGFEGEVSKGHSFKFKSDL